ncbi:hypothetical protein REPUB_Repub03eG0243700 [Reevesia pubescens]
MLIILGLLGSPISTQAQLQLGFYSKSCPKAEKTVLDFVHQHIPNAPSLAAAFIRMHFHDCFVRGCDASILLNSTSGNQAEKDAPPNLTVRGFDFIERVKSLLDAECPGIVSCADIIALVARDSIVATDPSLDSEYAANLKANKCKTPNDNTTKVKMDPGSRKTFDLSYYTLVLKRRGFFESDAALTTNPTSLAFIKQQVLGSLQNFFAEFANSMEKMGRINVKTGSQVEIRKHCALVN